MHVNYFFGFVRIGGRGFQNEILVFDILPLFNYFFFHNGSDKDLKKTLRVLVILTSFQKLKGKDFGKN